MTRRELMKTIAAAPLAGRLIMAEKTPAMPVSVASCPSYDGDLTGTLATMFDQLGGLGRVVKNKTVTIKVNLTGSPGLKFRGKPLGLTHYTHPKMAAATAYLLERSGARRVRFVESAWATAGPLEEYLLDSGWSLHTLFSASKIVEFENTNALGKGKRYSRFQVPGGGHIYPAFDLNHAYEDTDVFMSMAKLKNHATCGVTLSMKNCFGNTPASIYGDDAGEHEPNENPSQGRAAVCHEGKRQPAKSAPSELDPNSSRDPGYRMPRIVADLNAARPVDIALIDGIETIAGGEGPWIRGLRPVKPGVIIAGFNAVNTDTVATSVMGYDPRADKGKAPFTNCDNTLKLAEAMGLGSTDLSRIEVRGSRIADVQFKFSA
ncbi:MAG TPA: DUF362 domain-containing protein [Bryobacteraceae bacterium]|nr:DUF362 domain-containing protein [Bryobacteraceae bacterium]